jgi:hypothetical protein
VRLEQAIDLARRFHEGAVDKAGEPYFGHIQRVVNAVHSHEEKLAAAMHDLLEDTALTATDLRCAGCPPDIVHVVEVLTRAPGEVYDDFCRRAANNPVARVVKLADISDNSDEDRLARLKPEEANRLRFKYQRARSILMQTAEPHPEKTEREYEAEFSKIGIPQEEGDAWVTFWCVECGRPGGTLTLVRTEEPGLLGDTPGYHLVLTTFLGSMSPPISDEELGGVLAQLERGDAKPFYDRDHELAPFWCPRCQQSYCSVHWRRETLFDDGFFDEIVGLCPEGHRRQLWD